MPEDAGIRSRNLLLSNGPEVNVDNVAGARLPLDLGRNSRVLAGFAGDGHAHGLAKLSAGAADGLEQGTGPALKRAGFDPVAIEMNWHNAVATERFDLLAQGVAGFELDGNRRGGHLNRNS
jgi:hypothetical protein